MENVEPKPNTSGNRGKIILVIILVATSLGAYLWWHNYNKYIATNDANLDSDRISIAPMVAGTIIRQYVVEGDSVHPGTLLAELDSSEVTAQLGELIAQKKELEAQLRVMQANKVTATQTVLMRKYSFDLAGENFKRAKIQYQAEALPLEAYQANEEQYQTARVAYDVSKSQVDAAQAQIYSTMASMESVDAQMESLRVQLGYYKITSPKKGIVAKRWTLPGDMVQPGQSMFTINESNTLWLAIYLEETKYDNVFIGQQVKYDLDAYPGLTFWGKVFYIGSNTASQFSMIPASNASGNFTKVTQRIPIKISIDSISGDPKLKAKVHLVSGMSAEVKIIK